VTDLISPHNRGAALGLNMAAFALSFVVGPAIAGFITTDAAAWLSVAGTFTTILLLLVAVDESLGSDAKAKVDPSTPSAQPAFSSYPDRNIWWYGVRVPGSGKDSRIESKKHKSAAAAGAPYSKGFEPNFGWECGV